MKKALLYAIISTVGFSSTYVINRMVSLGPADWRWNAVLRHFIMLALLGLFLALRGRMGHIFSVLRQNPGRWLLWSMCGFFLFYAPLTYGSFQGESWLSVAVWQLSIVAGVLMTPLFFHEEVGADGGVRRVRNRIPGRALLFSLVILAGVFILQLRQAQTLSLRQTLLCVLPVTAAGFFYTLGNRKTMELNENRLNAVERVFAMTLCSMPGWILLMAWALVDGSYPTTLQTLQVAIVAISSGCIATPLFFKATSMVKDNPRQLAVVESMVAGEIPATLLGSVALGVSGWPDAWGFVGLAIIIAGMVATSLFSAKEKQRA